MSADSLALAMERLRLLEPLLSKKEHRDDAARDIHKLVDAWGCDNCGGLAGSEEFCAPCAALPKCLSCDSPTNYETDDDADRENNLCGLCAEQARQRKAWKSERERDRREAALDDLRETAKDTRRPVDAAIRALVDR